MSTNPAGYRGVWWKHHACIYLDGRNSHLGGFDMQRRQPRPMRGLENSTPHRLLLLYLALIII